MPPSLIGISIKVFSVVNVVIIAALVKSQPDGLPISQIIFFRCVLAIPFVVGYLLVITEFDRREFLRQIRPNRPWLHIRRSAFGMTSMALIFLSVRLLPLPIANALKELAPIFITLFAALFLGETIRIYRTTGLLIGIMGVAIITYDAIGGALAAQIGPDALFGAAAALFAAVTIALAQIQIRSMVKTESPSSVVFFFFAFTALVALGFAPFGWQWPSTQGWLWLLGIGAAGGAAQLGITIAFKYADASTIAPFEYFSIPFALLLGGLIFGEWPHPTALIGMALILIGGLIIIIRESQIARQT